MKSMYNTGALETFLGAVDSVRAEQRASDENRMRLRALESQLATEQAERNLLPDRLKLESKKLEYEMSMGKVDMLLKVAGTVNTLQDSQLGREVTSFQLGQNKLAAPYVLGRLKLQHQMDTLNAYYLPFEKAQNLLKMKQQNLLGPIYGISAWMTAMGGQILTHVKAIEESSKDIQARTDNFMETNVEHFKNGPRAGQVQGWKATASQLPAILNYANGNSGQHDPGDAMSAFGGKVAMMWGARHRKVDAQGNITYAMPDEQTSIAELRGTVTNEVTKAVVDQALSYTGSPSTSFNEIQKTYREREAAVAEAVKAAATGPDGVVNLDKKAEIEKKIDLLLYTQNPTESDELRAYLDKTAGGPALSLAVMGSISGGAPGLRQYGEVLVGYAEKTDGESRYKFVREDAPTWENGRAIADGLSKQVIGDAWLSPSNFGGIIDARVQRERVNASLDGMHKQMMTGLNFGNSVIGRAMADGIFDAVKEGVDSEGNPLTPGSLQFLIGDKINLNIDSYVNGLNTITGGVGLTIGQIATDPLRNRPQISPYGDSTQDEPSAWDPTFGGLGNANDIAPELPGMNSIR